jgi:hypothetical protein
VARKRDYKAEYQRRIANAANRGLTRSQARGHPGAGLAYVSKRGATPKRTKPDPKLEDAIKAIRAGDGISAAAKKVGVSRERLSAYAKQQAGAERKGRVWTLNDTRSRRVPLLVEGHNNAVVVKVAGHEPARLAGEHFDEAHRALTDQSLFPAFREKWSGVTITDHKGRVYSLSTDPNHLYRLTVTGDEIDWTRIYHLHMH